MKKLILLILFIPLFGVAQEKTMIDFPAYAPMFAVGSDSILSAANISSVPLNIGNTEGVLKLGIQSDTMSAGGTVAKDIAVYLKFRLSGMEWGVISDSIAVDSLFIGTIDSSYINNETPWYYDLSSATWWSVFDEMQVILDPATGADSIKFSRSKTRGY